MEVVRRDPASAAWFIELTMLFSIAGSLFACAVSGIFVWLYWDQCYSCDRPLRWWLLLQAALQLSQMPVRVVILTTVRAVHQAGGDLQSSVKSLTGSPAWRASKVASLVMYSWFILGVVWWFNSSKCGECPGVHVLTAAVMGLSIARAAVALVTFRFLFPQVESEPDVAETVRKVEPATARQINRLGVARFPRTDCKDVSPDMGDASCAVCLSDFGSGELIRRLPCKHVFHKGCIDNWLHRNKRCPLCMVAIDEWPLVAAPPGAQTRACQRSRSCNLGSGAWS